MKDDPVISYHNYRRIYPVAQQSHFWEFTRQIHLEHMMDGCASSLQLCVIAKTWQQPQCLSERTGEINDGTSTQWNIRQLSEEREDMQGSPACITR